ncbi:MAG: cupin domain-containing protein [Dehalococcoidales bacterium]|nr:cupin domain-containing protein [Dehalococcoidales bacterium]
MAKVGDTQQGIARMAREVDEEWQKSRVVRKSEELKFETNETGTTAQVINNKLGFSNKQISSFIREIPVGWKSGKHKHNMEAIIMIIQGEGYTVVDGTKHEWKKGDVISVPPMTVHQHFNTGKTEAARFFAVTTIPLMVNIGSFVAEQLENAGKI